VEAEVKAKYPGSIVKLIKGGGGAFDVTCNGTLIYSKLHIEGQRFPNDGEITRLIENERG
jgi:selT/selW/selH-like putative selenoprotein